MYINRHYQNYVVVCYLVLARSVSFKGGWGRGGKSGEDVWCGGGAEVPGERLDVSSERWERQCKR